MIHFTYSFTPTGETYLSHTHSETISIPLGSYAELDFTIGTCPTLDPRDIIVVSSSTRQPSVINDNQNVHVQLGPLGPNDVGNVSILVPTRRQGYIEYNSVLNIEIEGEYRQTLKMCIECCFPIIYTTMIVTSIS